MLERGKFGIEYDPRQREREPFVLGWVVLVVVLVALVSLSWTLVKKVRASGEGVAEDGGSAVHLTLSPPPKDSPKDSSVADPGPQPALKASNLMKRPQNVRNLLMRLEEAERRRDVEMAVTTIESIRALPGSPTADLDDALARRLGTLNIRRLFEQKNPQWVKVVEVKRGDSASRIAFENGSTLASLTCLNGGSVDRIVIGQKLYVMNHPRFNLVIHRRTRTADLSLNGKFFRRYDLTADVAAKEGAYEMTASPKNFWKALGAQFKAADRTELETLLPVGAPVLISEL